MRHPVYMLAIDHRWQWEEWCDASGVDRARIGDVKTLAAEAFLESRRRSQRAAAHGALLVDLTYGRQAFEKVRESSSAVGTPAEKAGAFPLEWTDSFEGALPGDFVKVLVRHRPDLDADVVERQRDQLLELRRWCTEEGKTFVLEVLVSPPAGVASDDAFDEGERPRLLAEYIRRSYERGLLPHFWKIEGMPHRIALAVVDEAIREAERPRQLILGKGAGMAAVKRWFEAAQGAPSAAGFAIGRTVYFEPSAAWLRGEIERDEALARIAANYEAVIAAWEGCHGVPA